MTMLYDLILVEDGVFDFGGVSGETGLDLRGCPGRSRVKSQGAETQVATLPPAPICLTSTLQCQCVEQC